MDDAVEQPFVLVFPQWQGSGCLTSIAEGAAEIEELVAHRPAAHVRVNRDTDLPIEANIRGRSTIIRQLETANGLIESASPERILTIGGDCGVEIAPVSYLHRRAAGEFAVVWFDAHGDLNTPASSPSRNFHGMPLRALLGEGDEAIVDFCRQTLPPKAVFLVGARELDPAEQHYILREGVFHWSPDELEAHGPDSLAKIMASRGLRKLYVHVDLDVLDPREFPWMAIPVPGGVKLASLVDTLAALARRFDVVGMSLTEFAPPSDASSRRAALSAIGRILRDGFGLVGDADKS